MNTLAIIGGGAAGLTAAVAQQLYGDPATSVTLFEASDKVGRPILRSGNGRCNFSHWPIEPQLYHGSDLCEAVFTRLESVMPADEKDLGFHSVARFFQSLGLVIHREDDGRLYPLANRASVVLDVLLRVLRQSSVNIRLESPIVSLVAPQKPGGVYTLEGKDRSLHRFERVIVACGGAVGSMTLPQDVAVNPFEPSLGALRIEGKPFKALDGQRLRGRFSLRRRGHILAQEQGEILFRTYGVSGIAILNLSRFAKPGDELVCDFLPENPQASGLWTSDVGSLHGENVDNADAVNGEISSAPNAEVDVTQTAQWLAWRAQALQGTTPPSASELLCGLFSRTMGEAICRWARVDEDQLLSDSAFKSLALTLRQATFKVEGMGPKDTCQISRGGIVRSALNSETLEVYEHPGLFIVGEAVDVDGPCGGYNLHWAFASALLTIMAMRKGRL